MLLSEREGWSQTQAELVGISYLCMFNGCVNSITELTPPPLQVRLPLRLKLPPCTSSMCTLLKRIRFTSEHARYSYLNSYCHTQPTLSVVPNCLVPFPTQFVWFPTHLIPNHKLPGISCLGYIHIASPLCWKPTDQLAWLPIN